MNEELVFILNQINPKNSPERCFLLTFDPKYSPECTGINCSNCVARLGAPKDYYVRKILTIPLNFK